MERKRQGRKVVYQYSPQPFPLIASEDATRHAVSFLSFWDLQSLTATCKAWVAWRNDAAKNKAVIDRIWWTAADLQCEQSLMKDNRHYVLLSKPAANLAAMLTAHGNISPAAATRSWHGTETSCLDQVVTRQDIMGPDGVRHMKETAAYYRDAIDNFKPRAVECLRRGVLVYRSESRADIWRAADARWAAEEKKKRTEEANQACIVQ